MNGFPARVLDTNAKQDCSVHPDMDYFLTGPEEILLGNRTAVSVSEKATVRDSHEGVTQESARTHMLRLHQKTRATWHNVARCTSVSRTHAVCKNRGYSSQQ